MSYSPFFLFQPCLVLVIAMTFFADHSLYLPPFRLQAGLLQLCPGTHLLLDEMALEPGRLEEKGVRNMAALGRVVQWQKVQYDFQYYATDFSCDLVRDLLFSLSLSSCIFSRMINYVMCNNFIIINIFTFLLQ